MHTFKCLRSERLFGENQWADNLNECISFASYTISGVLWL